MLSSHFMYFSQLTTLFQFVVPYNRYYRGTHGVIVVYDVSSGESFANVKRWLHEIEQNCDMVNKILGKLKLFVKFVANEIEIQSESLFHTRMHNSNCLVLNIEN